MTAQITLPSYRSLQTDRQTVLTYQTSRANTEFSAPVILTYPTGIAIPQVLSLRLGIGGIDRGLEHFVDTGSFRVGRDDTIRPVLRFNVDGFSSGIYPVTTIATSHYSDGSKFSGSVTSDMQIVSDGNSSFGVGWQQKGLRRLSVALDAQAVMLISPDGNNVTYRSSAVAGEFASPTANFSTFSGNIDGTYTLVNKYGIQSHFDANGLQTSVVDRNGNTTTYLYDSLNRLTSMIDPVGLATQYGYSGSRLSQITDPAGRTTSFDNNGGNITRVTCPDGTAEHYTYDEFLMTSRMDERSNVTVYPGSPDRNA